MLSPATSLLASLLCLSGLDPKAAGAEVEAPPKSSKSKPRFHDPKYWEEEYSSAGANSTYEWFIDSEAFLPLIRPHLRVQDHILQLGCGNSRLAEVMAAAGYEHLTSIDISPSVIAASVQKYPHETFPALRFQVGDVFNMVDFEAGSVDTAIDKGTWDAIAKPKSRNMLQEVRRVLKPGGLYLVLTFSKPSHALDFLLDWKVGWKVEDVRVVPNPLNKDSEVASIENFYLYICRNEDRGDDYALDESKAGPEMSAAVQQALEYQRVTRSFERHSSEL